MLAARRQEPMEKLAADLRRKYGVDVLVEAIDLASPGAAARLKSSLDAKSISIDILVNNAGYGLHGEFLETPIERTVDMIQLNITALTELSYLFGRDMAARRSGHILLVASLLAFQPVPSYAAYAATKSYVLALGEALHDELRSQGVVVTSLCPGHTETGFDAAAGATASPMLRLLTMKPRPVAESGVRALSGERRCDRGSDEQHRRVFKPADAAVDAESVNEKNYGGLSRVARSNAVALHPFGRQAGLASALLGFLQMGCAAIGASFASVLPFPPSVSLAVVLTTASALPSGLSSDRAAPAPSGAGRFGSVPESTGG